MLWCLLFSSFNADLCHAPSLILSVAKTVQHATCCHESWRAPSTNCPQSYSGACGTYSMWWWFSWWYRGHHVALVVVFLSFLIVGFHIYFMIHVGDMYSCWQIKSCEAKDLECLSAAVVKHHDIFHSIRRVSAQFSPCKTVSAVLIWWVSHEHWWKFPNHIVILCECLQYHPYPVLT